jgi:hypothetical protein
MAGDAAAVSGGTEKLGLSAVLALIFFLAAFSLPLFPCG